MATNGSTKKTQIQVKRNSNATYDSGDILLRRGEPFYNIPTGDLFMGNGEDTINELTPINASFLSATHTYLNGVHTFDLSNAIGNLTYFPVLIKFVSNYTSGNTIKLVEHGLTPSTSSVTDTTTVTYTCSLKTLDGGTATTNAFKSGTVNTLYVLLNKTALTADLFVPASSGGGTTTKYWLTYNDNSSTEELDIPDAYQFTSGAAFQLSTKTPTRTGYNFLGWSEQSSATVATYTAGQANVVFYKDTALYAIWQSQASLQVTYTLDPNTTEFTKLANQTFSPSEVGTTVTLTKGTTKTLPSPTTQGATFNKWTESTTGNDVSGGTTVTVNANVTYKAKWTYKSCACYFIKQDGTTQEIITASYKDSITLPTHSSTVSGKKFNGWKYNNVLYPEKSTWVVTPVNDASSVQFVETFIDEEVTTYTITYNSDGTTPNPKTSTKTKDVAFTVNSSTTKSSGTASAITITFNANGGTITSGTSTQSISGTVSYTFKNWSGSDGNSYTNGSSYTTNSALTLTATWNRATTYPTLASSKYPEVSYTGYNFVGWYDAQTGGNKITPGTTNFTTSKTLYAHWSQNYTLTYSSTYGTAPTVSQQTTNTFTVANPTSSMETSAASVKKYFAYWLNSEGSDYDPGDEYAIESGYSETLTAYFETISSGNILTTCKDEGPREFDLHSNITSYTTLVDNIENLTVSYSGTKMIFECLCGETDEFSVFKVVTVGGTKYILVKVVNGYSIQYTNSYASTPFTDGPQISTSFTVQDASSAMKVAGYSRELIFSQWKYTNSSSISHYLDVGDPFTATATTSTFVAQYTEISNKFNITTSQSGELEGDFTTVEKLYCDVECEDAEMDFEIEEERITFTPNAFCEADDKFIYKFNKTGGTFVYVSINIYNASNLSYINVWNLNPATGNAISLGTKQVTIGNTYTIQSIVSTPPTSTYYTLKGYSYTKYDTLYPLQPENNLVANNAYINIYTVWQCNFNIVYTSSYGTAPTTVTTPFYSKTYKTAGVTSSMWEASRTAGKEVTCWYDSGKSSYLGFNEESINLSGRSGNVSLTAQFTDIEGFRIIYFQGLDKVVYVPNSGYELSDSTVTCAYQGSSGNPVGNALVATDKSSISFYKASGAKLSSYAVYSFRLVNKSSGEKFQSYCKVVNSSV